MTTLGKLGQVKLEEYYPYVLAAYDKLGDVHTVCSEKEMVERMKPLFTTIDYALTPKRKVMRCKLNARMAVLDMYWFGYLDKTAPATYSLTDTGRKALKAGVLSFRHDNGPMHKLEFTLV